MGIYFIACYTGDMENIKKKDLVIITVAVVLVILGAFITLYLPSSQMASRPAGSNEMSFSMATGTINESGSISGQNYTVTADYPKLSGTPHADTLNAYFLASVQKQIGDFKAASSELGRAHTHNRRRTPRTAIPPV